MIPGLSYTGQEDCLVLNVYVPEEMDTGVGLLKKKFYETEALTLYSRLTRCQSPLSMVLKYVILPDRGAKPVN